MNSKYILLEDYIYWCINVFIPLHVAAVKEGERLITLDLAGLLIITIPIYIKSESAKYPAIPALEKDR